MPIVLVHSPLFGLKALSRIVLTVSTIHEDEELFHNDVNERVQEEKDHSYSFTSTRHAHDNRLHQKHAGDMRQRIYESNDRCLVV